MWKWIPPHKEIQGDQEGLKEVDTKTGSSPKPGSWQEGVAAECMGQFMATQSSHAPCSGSAHSHAGLREKLAGDRTGDRDRAWKVSLRMLADAPGMGHGTHPHNDTNLVHVS